MPERPLDVLARGDGWLVVAKPPRVLTHRNPFARRERAVIQRVRDAERARVYAVHRLDRAASGCLLLATRRELVHPLARALAAGRKSYVALVRGWFAADGEVVVDTPVKDDDTGLWKPARSRVRCLGRSRDPRCSLLLVHPETGRRHQVRRHVRDLSHPIVRDGEHGDSKVNRWWRDRYGVERLALHALSIEFEPPGEAGGGPLRVVCPLFADQAALYRRLPFWEEAVARLPELALPPLPLPDREVPAEAVVGVDDAGEEGAATPPGGG